MVKINGIETDAAGMTIAEYLTKNGYELKRVAAEVNGEIVPKAQYETFKFSDTDSVEIVSFVGGG